MNEYTTIMEAVESDFLLGVQRLLGQGSEAIQHKALLTIWVTSMMYKSLGMSMFGLRLPNVLLLISSFLGFYFLGKKIFGKPATAATLLVMGTSFLPVNFAKFAVGDTWLFAVQLMSFVLMILYLKQPIAKWKWGVWFFVVVGALVHPLSMLVWSAGLWTYLFFMHPKGKNLKELFLLPLLLVVYLPLGYFGYVSWEMPYFFMGIGSGRFQYYFVFVLLGLLPWFGFLPASLWDMIQKVRKKEELAIINLGWVLFAILSQSMIIVAAFSFLIAKNSLAFFQKNYPYKRWVKGFTLLNMIFTFCVLFIVLLGAPFNFEGGYRAVFGGSSLYWMASMASVLGLFMNRKSLVVGGMALSGLMCTWLFWLQVNPLVETQRDFPKQVFQTMRLQGVGKGTPKLTPLYHLSTDSIFYQKNFQVYLNELNVDMVAIDSAAMSTMTSKGQNTFAIIPRHFYNHLPSHHVFLQNKKEKIQGGTGFLKKTEEYFLIEN